MVRHSYYQPRKIKLYFSLSITLCIEVENNVSMQQQKQTFFSFFFVEFRIFCIINIHFYLDPSVVLPLSGKLEILVPHCDGHLQVWGRHCLTFNIEKRDTNQGKVDQRAQQSQVKNIIRKNTKETTQKVRSLSLSGQLGIHLASGSFAFFCHC